MKHTIVPIAAVAALLVGSAFGAHGVRVCPLPNPINDVQLLGD